LQSIAAAARVRHRWQENVRRGAKVDQRHQQLPSPVGSKCHVDGRRRLPRDAGRPLAGSLRIPLIETSATTAYNVDEMFVEMGRAIMSRVHLRINQIPHRVGAFGRGTQRAHGGCLC
jgi:hypothetical protein